ncbi:ATP-binding protein [Neobacillus rhizosphaerae]|uniref:ATP-binding protein n=1 Tax=Neobacillus rhizosphaerae TaxID=2880965 RepID=UPI003D271131
MLAEKLLLNVLITIAPVLLSSILMDNNRKIKSPYLCGFLQSIAAITCMLFSYANYGLHWDLRYVPLVLAILYGGPLAGGIVLSSIIGTRLILGGSTMVFGLASSVLTALIPFLLLKIFWRYSSNKRVLLTMLAGSWSLILCFLSLSIFRYLEGNLFKLDFNIPDLLLVGLIQTLALGLAAKLNEGLIERNKMKKEIQRAEKLNTLGELAASFAHEVRNPLTVVKGFLQLMQQEESGKNYQYLSLVLNELARAELIINDYLNFAKPQFEKIEEFSLKEVLAEVVILMEPLAAKQGVQLESELESITFILETHRNQFKQALVNLIKNGIEATPEGGKVTVHSKSDIHHATVKIADTGKGMTEEQLARIGTLFYTTKDKGTGLGTSVSLKIIETMHGKVSYHSVLGVGTEVTLLLPIGKKEQLLYKENAS